MESIYAIVTHHKRSQDAAEAWVRDGVCAIGFCRFDLSKIKTKEQLRSLLADKKERLQNRELDEIIRFLEIEEGDIILAYEKNNVISAVGKVSGGYEFNKSNLTGRPEEFNYPHQKRVEWLETPREFERKHLPEILSDQLGKRGITTIKINGFSGSKFLEALKALPIPSYEGKYNEELVKGGLSKYIKRNLNTLESGLTIIKEEKSLNEKNRPDFIARDSKGNEVIIECKGSLVDELAIDQIVRYRKAYGKQARYFLIAFTVELPTLRKAEKEGIEVFEVDLKFTKRGV